MSQVKATTQKHLNESVYNKSDKKRDIRSSNISAAKAVADVVRTSLGPRGMDKMIQDPKGEVLITNDGATILKQMAVMHPTAKMLVEISKAQDIEAGDGTTSVVVIAGALLDACETLLEKGIHPTTISEGFELALSKSLEILKSLSRPIELTDRESLMTCVTTALASKVVSSNSQHFSPIAVDAVLKIIDPKTATNVDLRDVRVVKKLGGTIEDTELVEGLVFTSNKAVSGGPQRIQNAKIALIQFNIAAPKTDVQNNIVVKDYTQIDRVLKEERKYIAELIKKIVASGANVLLIQKSVLREGINELAQHFLSKKGIMIVKDVEREDIEFISNTVNAIPVAHIDQLTPEKLGTAELAQEVFLSDESKVLKITGVPKSAKTITILCRGSNQLVIDEAERSLHDALCVVRSLVKNRGLLPGGGAPEIEISQRLAEWADTLTGINQLIVKSYAEALEVIPYTLSENAGLNPISIVTELRNKHAKGGKEVGINVKKGVISDDMFKDNVIQPALVTISALSLATECVRMIMKIDDIVLSLR